MSAVRVLGCPLLLLSLSGCAGRSLVQVRGEVRDWTFGPGRVAFLGDDRQTLSEADLDRVGRFNLNLPDEAVMTPLLQASLVPELPAGCSSTVKASSAARFSSLSSITAYPGSGQKNVYTLVSEDRGGSDPLKITRRLLIYASQAVQVRGQVNCRVNGQPAVTVYGLDLQPGWNRVASNQTVEAGGASRTDVAATGDDGFDRWTVAPAR